MFDNLRDLSEQPQEYEPGYDEILQEPPAPRLFGMTTGQRFVLSVLLLASVTMVGVLCLVVTGKVWI